MQGVILFTVLASTYLMVMAKRIPALIRSFRYQSFCLFALTFILAAEERRPDLYLIAGYVYSACDKNEEALKSYETALEIDHDSSKARFYLGAFYEKRGQKELAVKEFRETIKLDPKFAEAYNYLGYMFAEDGVNLDEALVLIKKAIELEPDNGAFIDSLGWAYFKKGDLDEALKELEKAVKLEPNEAEIRDHLGDAYFKKGFTEKAHSEWKKSLELNPKQDKVKEKLKKTIDYRPNKK